MTGSAFREHALEHDAIILHHFDDSILIAG